MNFQMYIHFLHLWTIEKKISLRLLKEGTLIELSAHRSFPTSMKKNEMNIFLDLSFLCISKYLFHKYEFKQKRKKGGNDLLAELSNKMSVFGFMHS